MARLNFSRVLRSPQFQDFFTITTVAGVIGDDGLETDTRLRTMLVKAIIVPGRLSTLRAADGSRVTAYIDIYTRYKLTAGYRSSDTKTREGDVITWHGRTYIVNTVEDYSAFGPGFFKASCDLSTVNSPN